MEINPVGAVFLIPILAIMGGFAFLIVRTVVRSRERELEIRERIAMIERGLVPAPEVDPKGFDRAMLMHAHVTSRMSSASPRYRRAGISLMGVGFGLMVLIGSTADVSIGFGVGGFLVVIGLAFLINSLFGGADEPPAQRYPIPPPPPPPSAASSSAPSPPGQRLD